jgi:hypothetical protein
MEILDKFDLVKIVLKWLGMEVISVKRKEKR